MVTCFGYRRRRYQIFESDPNTLLHFTGPDARRFKQINPPAKDAPATQRVEFGLTVADCHQMAPGFLPMAPCLLYISGLALQRRR
jgi:hypothetical protein